MTLAHTYLSVPTRTADSYSADGDPDADAKCLNSSAEKPGVDVKRKQARNSKSLCSKRLLRKTKERSIFKHPNTSFLGHATNQRTKLDTTFFSLSESIIRLVGYHLLPPNTKSVVPMIATVSVSI
jgi:hypothetical protein